MMKKLIYSGLLLIISIQACQNGDNSQANIPSTFTTDKIVANATDLQKLVTKVDIAKITGVAVDKISVFDKHYDDDIAENILLFNWENGNKEAVKSNNQNIELISNSSIGIGRLMKLTKANFEQIYRVKTKAELSAEIDKLVQDESINADIAIWEAKELAKQAKTKSFEKLENVGTLAYWETPLNVLHVLVKDVAFSVTTNLTDDEATSKQKAIALVELIIEKSTP